MKIQKPKVLVFLVALLGFTLIAVDGLRFHKNQKKNELVRQTVNETLSNLQTK